MERLTIQPRPNWRQRCEEVGFDFHTMNGVYWNEAACYRFTEREVDMLDDATRDLHNICVKAVDHVVRQNRFGELGIPEPYAGLCRKSWERQDFSLYGRFDLAFDGRNAPKMLEYNADTPTALLEAAVVQWAWLEDTRPEADQFNSLHERLLEGLKKLADGTPLYFSCVQESLEDLRTTEYLQDLAAQAGIITRFTHIEEVGWNGQEFVDVQERPIHRMFKLYPWEWMFRDEFGQHMLLEPWYLIEPPWKLILSSKGILPILWELFPGHPNLLPAFFDENRLHGPKVRKPRFSREGTNISIDSLGVATQGPYSDEGWIYQALANIPQMDGVYPVIGSWIIEDEPAGMGIREDSGPVTQDTSCFVPHYFE